VVDAVLTFDGSLRGLLNIFTTLFSFVMEAIVLFSGVGYALRTLGVFFEGTNETASKFFHTLADFVGFGKGLAKIFEKIGKRLPGLGRMFRGAAGGAGSFLKSLNFLKRPINFITNKVNALKSAVQQLGNVLKNNRFTKFFGRVKDSLLDPRSADEIAKSVNMSNRSTLGNALGNRGTGGTAGMTQEEINAALLARGIEPTPMPLFAKGGIVSKPTVGMIGEGGDREAVIPLTNDKLKQIGAGIASASGGMGANISFGDIVINGDGLNKHEIQAMIERELPKIINRSMRRGAQGVI